MEDAGLNLVRGTDSNCCRLFRVLCNFNEFLNRIETPGGDGWAVEEREGRGRCLVATRQLEVFSRRSNIF